MANAIEKAIPKLRLRLPPGPLLKHNWYDLPDKQGEPACGRQVGSLGMARVDFRAYRAGKSVRVM
jgi:hypothetical protein